MGGGDPNNVPCTRRGAMAMANNVAFFLRMDTFVCWQRGRCGNNGGGDVLVLAAARAGSGRLGESRWGEEEDAQWRWWRHKQWCLGIVGRPLLACVMMVAAQPMVPWHHQPFLACLCNNDSDNNDNGGTDNGASALAAVHCLLPRRRQQRWCRRQCHSNISHASLACVTDETVAMLLHGGPAMDNTMRGGGGGGCERRAEGK